MIDQVFIRLLIFEGHSGMSMMCADVARRLGLHYVQASDADAAIRSLEAEVPEVVLLDCVADPMSSMRIVEYMRARGLSPELILMTHMDTPASADLAMRYEAYDFIAKPPDMEELALLLERVSEKIQLLRENQSLREKIESAKGSGVISGTLEEMERVAIQQVFERVQGDKALAQKLLGISRATLYRKLKRYRIRSSTKMLQAKARAASAG